MFLFMMFEMAERALVLDVRRPSLGRYPRRARRGMALVVVMVTVILVALAAYGFNHQMTDAYRASRMQTERAQARLAALSGVEAMLTLTEMPRGQRRQQLMADSNAFHLVLESDGTTEAGDDASRWSFAVVSAGAADSLAANGASSAGWRFGWVNESAKLNISMLRQQNREFPGHARQALLNLPGASPADVDAFLKAHGISHGSSSGRDLTNEITTRSTGDGDSPPRRLARLWTGGDWDHNYRLNPLELALGNRSAGTATGGGSVGSATDQNAARGGGVVSAWRDFLTFHSGQRNESRSGQPRIFLNTGDLTRLHQQLETVFPSVKADFIVLARQFGLGPAASSGNQSTTVDSLEEASQQIDLSQPATQMIANPLDLIDARVQIPREEGRDLWVRSPFRGASLDASDYLTSLVDDVTVDPNAVINGQIDVTAAPREVLLGVPGLSEEIVQQIIQVRGSPPSMASPRDTVAWLVRENVIDLPTLRRLLPWITVGGDCYQGQVIGYRDARSPLFRCTVTFDGRSQPAVMQGFQQWHSWGRGFDVRQLRQPSTF